MTDPIANLISPDSLGKARNDLYNHAMRLSHTRGFTARRQVMASMVLLLHAAKQASLTIPHGFEMFLALCAAEVPSSTKAGLILPEDERVM